MWGKSFLDSAKYKALSPMAMLQKGFSWILTSPLPLQALQGWLGQYVVAGQPGSRVTDWGGPIPRLLRFLKLFQSNPQGFVKPEKGTK